MHIDIEPGALYLIDTITVPAAARSEVESAMQRNRAFLRTLSGFRGDAIFARDDAGGIQMVTIAAWESADALAKAREAVGAYYARIGFDMPRFTAERGVKLERALYTCPPELV